MSAPQIFHPFLLPVLCRSESDFVALATIMREAGVADQCRIDGYDASPNEGVAKLRAAEMVVDMEDKKKNILTSGHLRFIQYCGPVKEWRDRLVNVVLTLMEDSKGVKTWNFSMSHANHSGPQRVADGFATALAKSFLGEGYREVEPKAFWKTIRHFEKEYS